MLKFGQGKSTVTISGEQAKLITAHLKTAEPIIMSVLEKEVEKLAKNSESKWPVRMKKYGRSQNSKGKHITGFRIIPPSTVSAFVENRAPYAWAIRSGAGSETPVTEGQRVADVLLWQPAKKNVNNVLKSIVQKTISELRRK